MRAILVGLAVLIVLAGGALIAQRIEPAVRQPIQFNHAKHKARAVECSVCHQFTEEQAFAGLPPVGTCMLCHAAPRTESPEEAKVRQFAERGKGIPWQRLYRLPGHVFFSHRRHVTLAKVPCRTCHGAIAEASTPPARPAINQSMSWCIACHQQRRASVDCNACHR